MEKIDPTFARIVTGEVAAVAARGLSMPSDAAVGGIVRRTSILFNQHIIPEREVRELVPEIKRQAGEAIKERYGSFWQRIRDHLRDNPAARFRPPQDILTDCGLSRMDYAAVAAHIGLLWSPRRSKDVMEDVQAYLLDELDSLLTSTNAADERMYLMIAGERAVNATDAARLARSLLREEIVLPQLLINQSVHIECNNTLYSGTVYAVKEWVALIRPTGTEGWCLSDAYVREYLDGHPVIHTDLISEMVPPAFYEAE